MAIRCIRCFQRRLLSTKLQHIRKMSTVKLAYAEYKPSKQTTVEGPPLVVLHGLFGSKNNWQILCRKMADILNIQVLAVDVRNHGDSPHAPDMGYSTMSDDITYLLDSLNLSKAHLLAHSMGGRIAMSLALTKPEYLQSLIIEDVLPNVGPPQPQKYTRYMEAMLELDMRLNGSGLAEFRKHAMTELEQEIPDIRIRAFLVQNLVAYQDKDMARWKCNVEAIYNNWSKLSHKDISVLDTKFTGPTCFIGGAMSPYLPSGTYTAKEKDIVTKQFPNAEYRVIQGAGHWIHSEQPDAFMDTVCNFIRTVHLVKT